MKISFIIPVYNCEEHLEHCVNCILSIKFSDYEIILVDDGSGDSSGQICDEFAQRYECIQTIHQQNQGVSKARNQGLSIASGDYVIFADADDTMDPVKMSKILSEMEEDGTIDLTFFGLSFDYYYRGTCYRRDALSYPFRQKMDRKQLRRIFYELYDCNAVSPVWNKVIRRKVLTDNQIEFAEDMFLYEDLEFSIRCMACCNVFYNSPEIIYHYRQSEDEGNAGRRLCAIDDISDIVRRVETAVQYLNLQQDISRILLKLYLVLLREKIRVSPKKEIAQLGTQLSDWLTEKGIEHGSIVPEREWQFIDDIIHQRLCKLVVTRKLAAAKHRLAIVVKSTGLYQKYTKLHG